MNNTLFVAWRSGGDDDGCWGPVGRLEQIDDGYRFVYTRGAQSLKGFVPFPEMPELEAVYESDELFPLFANRLLAQSRPEYQAYLTWGGFDPDHPPDPIAILGITEGRRATDSIEVFPRPQPDAEGCYISKFFLRGVRWLDPRGLKRIEKLEPGEQLLLKPEPQNPRDPQAMMVLAATAGDGEKIGYVPRYLAQDIGDLYNQCGQEAATVWVERVNHTAPLQQRVLCRMNACWPQGFQPCGRDEFVPIVNGLPSILN